MNFANRHTFYGVYFCAKFGHNFSLLKIKSDELDIAYVNDLNFGEMSCSVVKLEHKTNEVYSDSEVYEQAKLSLNDSFYVLPAYLLRYIIDGEECILLLSPYLKLTNYLFQYLRRAYGFSRVEYKKFDLGGLVAVAERTEGLGEYLKITSANYIVFGDSAISRVRLAGKDIVHARPYNALLDLVNVGVKFLISKLKLQFISEQGQLTVSIDKYGNIQFALNERVQNINILAELICSVHENDFVLMAESFPPDRVKDMDEN